MIRARVRVTAGAVAVLSVVLLGSCGEQPPPAEAKSALPKKPAIPEGAIPALTAYYEIYKSARTLAPDLQTASIVGNEVEGVKSGEGKYGQWTVVFVSASKMQAYTFVYSTVEKGNILRGMNNQGAMRWAGPNRNAEPFTNSDFSIDSTKAFTAARTLCSLQSARSASNFIDSGSMASLMRFSTPSLMSSASSSLLFL